MRNGLTHEQCQRLPKYAREYIKELEGVAETATANLARWTTNQPKTEVWTTEYTNDKHITRYFEADNIEIEHKGVKLRVSGMWDEDQDLQLSWYPAGRGMPGGAIAFVPTAHQQAQLINLAYSKREIESLQRTKQRHEREQNER